MRHTAVVEDNDPLRAALVDVIAAQDCRVTGFVNCLDLLTQFDSVYFDLIVCDIDLPEMNGLQFIDRLQSLPAKPPVILIIASMVWGEPTLCIDRGAVAFLRKPFNAQELIMAIEAALKTRPDQR